MPILINGTSGDDRIDLYYDLRGSFEVWAGDGDDVVFGSPKSDLIIGGDGDDRLLGYGGNDTLYGWDGVDRMYGGEGDDTLVGGEGGDDLLGGEGNDELFGEAGNDDLHGNSGDDTLNGGADDDIFEGGAGRDTLTGGPGNDIFFYNSADVYTIPVGHPWFQRTKETTDTDRITDFDTTGSDFDRIGVELLLMWHSNYSNSWDPANTAADAIAQGYIYWLQSGSGAAATTTVYVDPDGGAHAQPRPFFMGQTDFAIATLDGVVANQLNASHFIV